MGQIMVRMLMTQLARRYSQNRTEKSLIIVGLLYIVVALASYFIFFDYILDIVLGWLMQLKNDGFIFNIWKDTPLTIKVWVFHIKNGLKFQNGLEWPRLHEIGPFVFNVHRKRNILGWLNQNDLVRFDESFSVNFDKSQSIGPLSMRIHTVNALLLLLLRNLPHSSVNSSSYSSLIQQQYLVEEYTVGDILNIKQFQEDLNINKLSIKIFNNQTIGPIEVYTGYHSSSVFNHFYSYKNQTHFNNFQHDFCNQIQGTEGTFFGHKRQDSYKYLFKPHLACRPWKFNYNGQSNWGLISTEQYLMDINQLSMIKSTENWCYCPPDSVEDDCDGLFYLKLCSPESSLFLLTNVHFLETPHLFKMVRGLQPNPLKHLGFMEIEPTFGATVESNLRFQYNLDMRKYFKEEFENFTKYRPVVLPYFWIEENYNVQGILKKILSIVSIFLTISTCLYGLMGSFGICLIMIGLIRLFRKLFCRNSTVGV